MSDSERKYTGEYVEICTSLENIRTRIEIMEQILHDIHQNFRELSHQVDKNRTDIAGIRATATLLGGVAGAVLTFLSRWLFVHRP